MLSRLTPIGRLTVTIAIVLGLFGVYKYLSGSGIIGAKSTSESTVINKIDLPDAPKNASTSVATIPLPSNRPANIATPEVRWMM
jgi:OmpA-OmpF porin, OOP family